MYLNICNGTIGNFTVCVGAWESICLWGKESAKWRYEMIKIHEIWCLDLFITFLLNRLRPRDVQHIREPQTGNQWHWGSSNLAPVRFSLDILPLCVKSSSLSCAPQLKPFIHSSGCRPTALSNITVNDSQCKHTTFSQSRNVSYQIYLGKIRSMSRHFSFPWSQNNSWTLDDFWGVKLYSENHS